MLYLPASVIQPALIGCYEANWLVGWCEKRHPHGILAQKGFPFGLLLFWTLLSRITTSKPEKALYLQSAHTQHTARGEEEHRYTTVH